MTLTELYQKGKESLESRKIGFTIQGVETGWVLMNNRRAMDGLALHMRAINGPESASAQTELWGVPLETPVIMSAMTSPIPSICEDGLVKMARGLKAAGSLMWLGTPMPGDLSSLIDTGVPLIVNLHKPVRQRDKLYQDLDKLQEQGVSWIGIEVDSGQGTKVGDQIMVRDCVPLSFAELCDLRGRIAGKMILKGILSGHDAVLALEAGADAIMVSNHGGHTLDYLPHPFQMAEEILSLVAGRVPVWFDGGFRRGGDVLKGLALGADLVGLGRPLLYGLAADGEQGVTDVVRAVTAELIRNMIMVGASRLEELDADCLVAL